MLEVRLHEIDPSRVKDASQLLQRAGLVAMHFVTPMRSRTTECLESRERLDTTESFINQLVAIDKAPVCVAHCLTR